ncbi:MAG: DUF4956 domain-containing protein [Clostridia bacterium]|nr:DUF4956 domain-containing protein [Clostridia bacterium]
MLKFVIPSILTNEFTVGALLAVTGSAFAFGLVLSLVYLFSCRKERYSKGLSITLVLLPVIIGTVIMLVSDSFARAFGLAGAFSIIRFRSTQGNPKDLAYIFAGLSIGLACGMGYILCAAIITVLICAILLVLGLIKYGSLSTPPMLLKISVPESLNYVGVFDECLAKYTKTWKLVKVKSSNFGTMFDLTFDIKFKNGTNTKEFIDELRTINGNLNILLQNNAADPDILV